MNTDRPPVAAVLFDRDGTLVADVPYNGDPDRVRLLPGAAAAVRLVRRAGLGTAVVSNQSGIGRGLLTTEQVRAVNERADRLLGGVGAWLFCPHAPDAGCACRKPRPGLILEAAARLGLPPARCLVIGDIAADVLAARAAGARGVLVPNAATAPEEVHRFATDSAPDLLTAVREALTEAGTAAPAADADGAGSIWRPPMPTTSARRSGTGLHPPPAEGAPVAPPVRPAALGPEAVAADAGGVGNALAVPPVRPAATGSEAVARAAAGVDAGRRAWGRGASRASFGADRRRSS
ncbi:D-glycero-alpha-D-manno-heptose-1,7-bisphosphate 7-phosphatase [Streptomyces sp. IBSBF 3136]|uniref:D-glycero-alpha-D-manno-heptose-1,7-bisphosphate 7-phosphatase n=1 Tax=Streptomyces sp. IBSBF 3136 TaxID=2903524 RepID=UPI002FDC6064